MYVCVCPPDLSPLTGGSNLGCPDALVFFVFLVWWCTMGWGWVGDIFDPTSGVKPVTPDVLVWWVEALNTPTTQRAENTFVMRFSRW